MTARRHNSRSLASPALFLLFASLAACGTLVGNPEEDDGDGEKSKNAVDVTPVVFSLTDAPVDDAKQVLLTIESLEVSLDGDAWTTIPLTATSEIDLLQYQNGESLPLAQLETLPAGTYNQTRLTLSESAPPRIVLGDDSVHDLEIPSADHTGVKIVTPFVAETGKPLAITIDFDLRKSVKLVAAGDRYQMKPVLRLVRDDEAGAVAGESEAGAIVCVYQAGATKDGDADCAEAVNTAKVEDEHFHVAFLPAGDYEIRIWQSNGVDYVDVPAVSVTPGATTDVGSH